MSMKSVPQPGDPPAAVVTNSSVEDDNTLEHHSIEDWQHVYSVNVLPVQKPRTFLQLMWITLDNRVLVSLTHSPSLFS